MKYQIRPAEISDARGINALRRMPGVMENILGIPSEPLKRSEEYLAGIDSNNHQFVAVIKNDDGTDLVIGTAGLNVSPRPRNRHTATIGIMVHKDYQEKQVGTALMQAVLDVADNWLMLVRVELTVFVDNERAIHLYEKLGFEKEGIVRKAAIRNGEYTDEYLMSRIRNA